MTGEIRATFLLQLFFMPIRNTFYILISVCDCYFVMFSICYLSKLVYTLCLVISFNIFATFCFVFVSVSVFLCNSSTTCHYYFLFLLSLRLVTSIVLHLYCLYVCILYCHAVYNCFTIYEIYRWHALNKHFN